MSVQKIAKKAKKDISKKSSKTDEKKPKTIIHNLLGDAIIYIYEMRVFIGRQLFGGAVKVENKSTVKKVIFKTLLQFAVCSLIIWSGVISYSDLKQIFEIFSICKLQEAPARSTIGSALPALYLKFIAL